MVYKAFNSKVNFRIRGCGYWKHITGKTLGLLAGSLLDHKIKSKHCDYSGFVHSKTWYMRCSKSKGGSYMCLISSPWIKVNVSHCFLLFSWLFLGSSLPKTWVCLLKVGISLIIQNIWLTSIIVMVTKWHTCNFHKVSIYNVLHHIYSKQTRRLYCKHLVVLIRLLAWVNRWWSHC